MADLVPVEYDPWNSGDPEAAGAAAASTSMEPAVQAHLAGVGQDLQDWGQQQAANDQRLSGQPLAAQALDPQSLATATNIAMGTGPGAINAFHGSPHDFDYFDTNKIGIGEGNQAYGHGLYFADNEGIAKGYRDRLSPPAQNLGLIYKDWPGAQPMDLMDSRISRDLLPDDLKSGANEIYTRTSYYKPENITPDFMSGMYGDLTRTIDNLSNAHAQGRTLMDKEMWYEKMVLENAQNAKKVLDLAGFGENPIDEYGQHISVQYPLPPSGKMYQVGIDAHPDSFLHWDKPLNQQSPQVQQALVDNAHRYETPLPWTGKPVSPLEGSLGDRTGAQFVTDLEDRRTPEVAAQSLADSGIPGIRYLDANSRQNQGWKITPPDQTVSGKWMVKSNDYNSKGMHFDNEADAQAALSDKIGQQKHNYVVFDDKMISIIKKYGLAPLVAGGAMTLGGNADAATHAMPVDHDPYTVPVDHDPFDGIAP